MCTQKVMNMAKKEASKLFEEIMKASVKGNPKPKLKDKKKKKVKD